MSSFQRNALFRRTLMLITLSVLLKFVFALPAPVPLPQIDDDEGTKNLGNPGWSAHSWCQANSDKAIAQRDKEEKERQERERQQREQQEQRETVAMHQPTGLPTLPIEMSSTKTFTNPNAQSFSNETHILQLVKKLFKRQTIAPSNPCRHPNPIFPDEGPPSSVGGCNADPMAPDGSCPHKDSNKDCAYYCEVRREYFYGKEQRWMPAQEIFPYPDAPRVTVTKGEMVSVAVTMDFGLGIDIIFIGIATGIHFTRSWSWINSRTYMAPTWDIMYPYCGYFTFIPKMVRSCGSVSIWPKTTLLGPMGAGMEVCDWSSAPRTYGNICVEMPWRNANDEVEGTLIIVKVECGNEQVLAPPCEQDKKYLLPGVIDKTLVNWNMSNAETQRWLQYQNS
ncbi:hypothetical protein H072_8127 [Dactylellina haptotyla CBS 200.50]|uniref:Uncharacterized protein n=1 Tax=Dactylellina haptotyla (strain CBS 200.50) TaxID=1284197 RepID=S8BFR8_DACHA|nr:hypothetical protein H072_8127 [Dactylellina haptotyla CBS 200.50]